MSTLTKAKKPAAKKPCARGGKPIRSRNPWVGYGEGKLHVPPGVDLTKPTLPLGKYL